MNPISDMLQAMRLTGGIFLEAHFTDPWAVRAQVTPEDCSAFMQMPRQIIPYHLITTGSCMMSLDRGTEVRLDYGDLVILPHNPPHILASRLDLTPVSTDGLIQTDGGIARLVYGGDGESTQLLCGFLGSNTEHRSFTATLPEILKLSTNDWAAASWIKSTFQFAIQESGRQQAESRIALAKLAELLFLEAVRRYFELHPEARNAVMAGMHDVLVGRALELLQTRIFEDWTTELLAREVGLSRSSFAERFTRELGEPPMRYLARRRLERASARLRESSEPISRIAFESGYESESAFNRAFRRMYGTPPATWRRRMMEQ